MLGEAVAHSRSSTEGRKKEAFARDSKAGLGRALERQAALDGSGRSE